MIIIIIITVGQGLGTCTYGYVTYRQFACNKWYVLPSEGRKSEHTASSKLLWMFISSSKYTIRELATYCGFLFQPWNKQPESWQNIAELYCSADVTQAGVLWGTYGYSDVHQRPEGGFQTGEHAVRDIDSLCDFCRKYWYFTQKLRLGAGLYERSSGPFSPEKHTERTTTDYLNSCTLLHGVRDWIWVSIRKVHRSYSCNVVRRDVGFTHTHIYVY